LKILVLLGAAAIRWSFWLCKNGLIFEKKHACSSLQVLHSIIFGSAHGLSSRSLHPGFGCSGIATTGLGGYNVFLLST
jgi:hypothetical protein